MIMIKKWYKILGRILLSIVLLLGILWQMTSTVFAQGVFSVEKISKEDFLQAQITSADYNIYPQALDTIAQKDVLNAIFLNAKERIDALDSIDRCEIYFAFTDDELYCIDNLLYYPDLKLLGFKVPLEYHNNFVWWYDSTTSKPMGETHCEPIAVNKNGAIVGQVLADCDIILDLHFYQKQEKLIYETQTYKNNHYYFMAFTDEEPFRSVFWHQNNLLYIRSGNLVGNIVYLKISMY